MATNVLTMKHKTRSDMETGISHSSMAFALSVKKIIWTDDRTAIKKMLFTAIPLPETIMTGNANSAMPISVAGAISAVLGIRSNFNKGIIGIPSQVKRGVCSVNKRAISHRAVNRMILSRFLSRQEEEIPYIYIPQDRYYHIRIDPYKRSFELVPYRRAPVS